MKHIRSLILALALVLSAGLAPAFAQAPPPVPALPDAERRTSYVISASTCACNVGFQLYQDSTDVANWLKVYINGVEIPQSSNWNITSPSGSISTLPRPITDGVLTFTTARTGTVQIVGGQRPRRLSEYAENRGVAARDLNQTINGIEAQLREMWDRQFRVVQAPPGETLALLPPLASRASMGACFDSSGNLAPCIAAAGSFVAGSGIGFTGTNPTTISYTGATYSAGNGIVFTGTNPTVISANPSISSPVIATRALAITQNLSAYTVVQTLGYATAGDGGGATFVKTAGVFKDTFVISGTRVGGSGYVNGTYYVSFGGGSSTGCAAQAIVAGGIVTTLNFDVPCPGYAVGDVLTITNAQLGGSGSGFTYTLTSVSTPMASFTDSVGTKWQYVVDQNAMPNVRQFGAKLDWVGVDATATDDTQAFYSAISFASNQASSISALVFGTTVIVPKGTALICGQWQSVNTALLIPQGTTLAGVGAYGGSGLHLCTAETNTNHFVTLCGVYSTRGQINCAIRDLSLTTDVAALSSNNIAMIYSSAGQQLVPLAQRLWIVHNLRGCIYYEKGIGGAAAVAFKEIECQSGAASISNNIITIAANVGGTQMIFRDITIDCALCTTNGFVAAGGSIVAEGIHQEGVSNPFTVANPGKSVFRNITIGAFCSIVFTLTAANTNNVTLFENVDSGSCPNIIVNGHASGVNYNTSIVKQIICGTTCS